MKRLIPLLLTAALFAAACGDDSSSTDAGGSGGDGSTTTTAAPTTTTTPIDESTDEGALAAARQRWADNGLTSYRMTAAETCFCPETVWVHTVVDGQVTSHEPASAEPLFDPGPRTMETLFDEIADAIADGYAALDTDYDPDTGAVISYYVDIDEMMADEEHGVRVTALEPYDPADTTVEIDAAALTDDYGCGYGFEKGSADQTLRLSLTWVAGFDADAEALSSPVNFPDTAWNATVTTGTDLYANYCDDLILVDEPTPVVSSTWTLVEGTLTIGSDTMPNADEVADVRATLTAAVVESATGDRVDLGDVELHNTCWGCFAG